MKLPQIEQTDAPTKARVRSFLDLSTGHFTKEDNAVLKHLATHDGAPTCPLYVYDMDQGYIVLVHGCDEDWQYTGRQKIIDAGLSLAFVELVTYARLRGYTGIWFDADADDCQCFPTFSWEPDVPPDDETEIVAVSVLDKAVKHG
jgi:hypothetical protein